jgi:sec-independent protein translocase protein TatA
MSFLSPSKDLVIVLAILVLFFGPKQLPKLARSLGESRKALREGRRGITSAADATSEQDSDTAAA